eukprot:TRINITY_DN18060_c0_g1_i1.p1 TRINITY_DN18060_c0_g1~~TRINITY_DN18060_c0_g1_i1.p1  ORF type:complete len:107 (-),score=24.30 TRINITY_DN18060_c0_g1_i1:340-660(-)
MCISIYMFCLFLLFCKYFYMFISLSFFVVCISMFFFFFFKQKTAYEMLRSLVGSEMCIRDSYYDDGITICCNLHRRWTVAMGLCPRPSRRRIHRNCNRATRAHEED